MSTTEFPTRKLTERQQPLILVVDDEPEMRTFASAWVTYLGYECLTAENGEEALQVIAERHPDLVVLDWMMPRMAGIEVLRKLRQDKATERLPVAILSARDRREAAPAALAAGANAYWLKTDLDFQTLGKDIESMLADARHKTDPHN